ncbi:related to UBX domain-containing protein 1 [Ramularia collo-cygni]|uniref:Related to UBX domain-containing protein 1 n=1 Tax=Ramularia collo-cygni TaxID=112498 RepID=A0A2D3V2D0_9PEZI|nr:related to UBX domain-containing protein 1 [Ramularia collo-cygni]CZT21978.1 related to UBX domain-containing protein 1 [Ramularia collo-cygni]
MDDEQSQKVANFSSLTGCNPKVAQDALAAANWNLEQAVTLYYASQDEAADEDDEKESESTTAATASGPVAGSSSAPQSKSNARGGKPKAMTLADLQTGDDDDEEKDPNQDLFTGGEKSGLAVKNPDQSGPTDHFRNIMNQARTNRDRPSAAHGNEEEENEEPRSSAFTGRAQTLGGDDAPSQVVQDPTAAAASAAASARPRHPRVNRTLHLWADGVSIDDGPLLRFDDPANEHIMAEINQGRAPKALLDVQPDQEVDLNLEPHRDENYVAPKPKYKPFAGQGQRLGSPTPGPAPPSSSSTARPAPAAATSTPQPSQMAIDESQPTLQLQIRLGDGTRLVSRFNTSHTIGDVYDFVNLAAPSAGRPWALMTTFPSKELDDKAQVLGDISEFQRGGVVVQKWK